MLFLEEKETFNYIKKEKYSKVIFGYIKYITLLYSISLDFLNFEDGK